MWRPPSAPVVLDATAHHTPEPRVNDGTTTRCLGRRRSLLPTGTRGPDGRQGGCHRPRVVSAPTNTGGGLACDSPAAHGSPRWPPPRRAASVKQATRRRCSPWSRTTATSSALPRRRTGWQAHRHSASRPAGALTLTPGNCGVDTCDPEPQASDSLHRSAADAEFPFGMAVRRGVAWDVRAESASAPAGRRRHGPILTTEG